MATLLATIAILLTFSVAAILAVMLITEIVSATITLLKRVFNI